MTQFSTWFSIGMQHIISLDGLDHILFICLLVLGHGKPAIRSTLILITGFTIGHALSMALFFSAFTPDRALIELLIGLTILAGTLFRLFSKTDNRSSLWLMLVVIIFGLIHGLGFAASVRPLLSDAFLPLLYFNLGVECGQLIIAAGFTIIYLFLSAYTWPFTKIRFILLCLIGCFAVWICAERAFQLFSS